MTKATTRIQIPETGGGILADEMGMGKSLSILALITKTMEDAFQWISKQSNGIIPDGGHRRNSPSRATLVIVPSASKSLPRSSELRSKLLRNFVVLINEWLNEIKM